MFLEMGSSRLPVGKMLSNRDFDFVFTQVGDIILGSKYD